MIQADPSRELLPFHSISAHQRLYNKHQCEQPNLHQNLVPNRGFTVSLALQQLQGSVRDSINPTEISCSTEPQDYFTHLARLLCSAELLHNPQGLPPLTSSISWWLASAVPLFSATCAVSYACSVGLYTGLKRSLAHLQSSRAHGAELCISKTSSVFTYRSSDPATASLSSAGGTDHPGLCKCPGADASPFPAFREGVRTWQVARGTGMLPVLPEAALASPSCGQAAGIGTVWDCGWDAVHWETQAVFSPYPLPGWGIGHLAVEGKAVEASWFSLLWSYHYFLPQPEFFPLQSGSSLAILHFPPVHRCFDTFSFPPATPQIQQIHFQLFLSPLKLSIPSLRSSLYPRWKIPFTYFWKMRKKRTP